MKKNYQAWNINIDDFYKITDEKEKIKFLLNFAVLAPSSHNSQPWGFRVGNDSIEVFLEERRKLVYGDKNNRQAYISIGCAIENIKIAADYFNNECQVILLEDEKNNHVATIIIKSKDIATKQLSDHSILAILERSTNRSKYSNDLPPADFISKIEYYSNDEVKVFVITDKNKINKIADVVLNASTIEMENINFRKELCKYVKNNLTNSALGIPAFGMGIPMLISFLVPKMVKYFNMSKFSKKDDEKLLKEYTPVMVIIATKEDNKKQWIQSGRIYENIALEANKNRMSTSVLAAPIETEDFYKDLQNILSTNFRPQIFFRIGYSGKKNRHSPRLNVNEVLIGTQN